MPRSSKKLARKNRRLADPSVLHLPPYTAVTTAGVGSPTTTALVTFAGVMNVTGKTPTSTIAGVTVTGATQVSPTVAKLTTNASATVAGAAYTIATNDPAFRSPAGGFVSAKTGTL
jgi:hypothetical protein